LNEIKFKNEALESKIESELKSLETLNEVQNNQIKDLTTVLKECQEQLSDREDRLRSLVDR